MQKLSLRDLDLMGKRVLMRVDFNVPLDAGGEIADDTRIIAALPSIHYILDHGASLILMSHLGRPKGKPAKEFSLQPCAHYLSELLERPVMMAPDCVGPEVEKLARELKPGDILMLENLRFHRAEEHPEEDPAFVSQLASLGDVYVNDAFGTAHREHASTASVARLFPGKAAAGFLMEKEIEFLGKALMEPKRPFYAIIGGAKVSTKLGVLKALIKKVDGLLIGGGMAYTFLKAQGIDVGNSLLEEASLREAQEVMDSCASSHVKLLLPVDHVVAKKLDDPTSQVIETSQGIPMGFQGVDIGPKTVALFVQQLADAATIFWNGPLGVCENPQFAKGTEAIAKAVASLPAISVVGGGDSVAALSSMGVTDQISHVSTGGGASLEFLEFGILPGIDALSDK
ncbi:MAG: phosphoglycerate kinase [Parachlamydia sp.]|nr:phosphoglycerate kinase [Parachlamydia sp.]